MKRAIAAVIVLLACLVGGVTLIAGLQLAYDVATNPDSGVGRDAMTILPMFGLPLIIVALLAVVGRGLLRGR